MEDCKIFGVESASTEGRVLSRETTRLTERARIYSALSELRARREGGEGRVGEINEYKG